MQIYNTTIKPLQYNYIHDLFIIYFSLIYENRGSYYHSHAKTEPYELLKQDRGDQSQKVKHS